MSERLQKARDEFYAAICEDSKTAHYPVAVLAVMGPDGAHLDLRVIGTDKQDIKANLEKMLLEY